MAGCPVESDWGYFPVANRCFPVALIEELVAEARLPGVMGNCHASGTAVIEELGARHMESGEPIIYTSADSVFQIAAHEETFGLERLMSICVIARRLRSLFDRAGDRAAFCRHAGFLPPYRAPARLGGAAARPDLAGCP
jgi:phosphopentomutase